MTVKVSSFDTITDEFDAYVGSIGYATMVTVDAHNRPRTRVLIPVWDPQPHVLRLTPWRIQVIRGTALRSRIWEPQVSTRRDPVAAGSREPR